MLDDYTMETTCEEYYFDEMPDEWEEDLDLEMGFDPYEGCYTWDC